MGHRTSMDAAPTRNHPLTASKGTATMSKNKEDKGDLEKTQRQEESWQQQQYQQMLAQAQQQQPQTPGQYFGGDASSSMFYPTGAGGAASGYAQQMASRTPGGFTPGGGGAFDHFAGQTPMTAASFRSLGAGGGGATPQQQAAAYGGMLEGMMMQPTPLVRRGAVGMQAGMTYPPPAGMMQQQQSQSQQQQQQLSRQSPVVHQQQSSRQRTKRKAMDPIDEEDPSMLRYESRQSHSPMANHGDEEEEGKEEQKRDESSSSLTNNRTGTDPSSNEPSSSSGTSGAPGGQQAEGPVLSEFPFAFDGYAAWVCRHCQHIPPYYRGGNYVWQASQPPSNQFVDLHLRFCPGLNPENMPQPAMEQQMLEQEQQMMMQAFHGMQQGMPGMQTMSRDSSASSSQYPMQQTMQQAQAQYMMAAQQQLWQQQQEAATGGPQDPTTLPDVSPKGAPDPPSDLSPKPGEKRGKVEKGKGEKGSTSDLLAAAQAQQQQQAQAMVPWQYAGDPPFPGQQQQYPYQYPFQMPGAAVQYPSQMQPSGQSPEPPTKKRRTVPKQTKSPKGKPVDDAAYKQALDFLNKKAVENARPPIEGSDVGKSLIDRTDADLLTDYFFHMMQQLIITRFTEKDRKTRGGKRESIVIGYGGLQCLHCIEQSNARKFYWSTVDRLANSFAEIPTHVLKCKICPDDVKEALLVLKGRHSDQMQMLPRGSQKVFFRRVWRRLHNGDSGAATPERRTQSPKGMDPSPMNEKAAAAAAAEAVLQSPKVTSGAAADMLAKSTNEPDETEEQSSPGGTVIPSEQQRVLLAIPEDKDWLSDMDCYIRNNIEVFSAKQSDVDSALSDRKYPIKIGQVGIRCIHCANNIPAGAKGAGVSYPYSVSGIYESVREFQRLHLDTCKNVPKELKEGSQKLVNKASSLSSVLRRYYVQAARALGLYDTEDGIRAGGTPVPMSTAGFQKPGAGGGSNFPKEPTAPHADKERDPPETEKKRKAPSPLDLTEKEQEEGSDQPAMKRLKSATEGEFGLSIKGINAPFDEKDELMDAPAEGDVPGTEDAPGKKATESGGKTKEDAPGEKMESKTPKNAVP